METARIAYLILLISLGANIGYMGWWAAKCRGKVSSIFACVGVLFLALFVRYAFAFDVYIQGPDYYSSIKFEWWWQFKDLLVAVVSAVVTGIFTYRTFIEKDEQC